MGLEAMHLSYPHWEELWDWRSYPNDIKWVIINRRPDIAVRAAFESGHPGVRPPPPNIRRNPQASIGELKGWYEASIRMFATIPGAYWMSYEALVADPDTQIGNLARWLHIGSWKTRQIRDENAKWLHGS